MALAFSSGLTELLASLQTLVIFVVIDNSPYHMSCQMLLNPSESEVGMTMEDYIVLADIPKIQLESEEELPELRRRNQSPSPCRDPRLRTYRLVVPHDAAWDHGITSFHVSP